MDKKKGQRIHCGLSRRFALEQAALHYLIDHCDVTVPKGATIFKQGSGFSLRISTQAANYFSLPLLKFHSQNAGREESMRGLDHVIEQGAELKALSKHSSALPFNMGLAGWVSSTGRWISDQFPDTGLVGDWYQMSSSDLGLTTDQPRDGQRVLAALDIDTRLRWLSNLPAIVKSRQLTTPQQVHRHSLNDGRREVKLALTSRAIVDPARLEELQTISSNKFDLTKLIRLCQEMNLAFATESYLSMAMLTRAIIDHVPPIFGMKNFSEVANNYAGSSSAKKEFKNLETTARNIADLHLHSHIRRKEVLPTITQVDASNSLDLLLSEIIAVLHKDDSEAS